MKISPKYDIFLSAGLAAHGCFERNLRIIDTIIGSNLTVFAPQLAMPINKYFDNRIIYRNNVDAITFSKYVLFVPDGAGEGVYYEVGLADGLKKPILGYSEEGIELKGKIIKGRWDKIPSEFKADTIVKLENMLNRIKIQALSLERNL